MRGKLWGFILLGLTVMANAGHALEPATGKQWVYFGTYTGEKSKGIYLGELDLASGALTMRGLAAETRSPSFLALHPNGRYLYAVGETDSFQGRRGGAVSAFAIDPQSGGLKLLNQQSSGGAGPCHVVVDKTGRCVLVANYGGGSVASLPLDADGKLLPAASVIQHQGKSVNPQRQEGPHAHSINVDPANRFAFAADLGLDKVLAYRLDPATGKITPHEPHFAAVAAGSGPRHFAFHPSGKYAYVINEMLCTVTAFRHEDGSLNELQTITTLPEEVKPGYSTAEVQVHPSGKFVYGSNRGHNSIAIFAVDAASGRLTPVGRQSTLGKTPRNFGIDPTGQYLLAANQDSSTVAVFRIDQETGKLQAVGQPVEVPTPVCVKFLTGASGG